MAQINQGNHFGITAKYGFNGRNDDTLSGYKHIRDAGGPQYIYLQFKNGEEYVSTGTDGGPAGDQVMLELEKMYLGTKNVFDCDVSSGVVTFPDGSDSRRCMIHRDAADLNIVDPVDVWVPIGGLAILGVLGMIEIFLLLTQPLKSTLHVLLTTY